MNTRKRKSKRKIGPRLPRELMPKKPPKPKPNPKLIRSFMSHPALEEVLEAEATRKKISVSLLIRRILHRSLGVKKPKKKPKRSGYLRPKTLAKIDEWARPILEDAFKPLGWYA